MKRAEYKIWRAERLKLYGNGSGQADEWQEEFDSGYVTGSSETYSLLSQEIGKLQKEIKRLEEFEWKYNDLCK